jgi:hypothetical protein
VLTSCLCFSRSSAASCRHVGIVHIVFVCGVVFMLLTKIACFFITNRVRLDGMRLDNTQLRVISAFQENADEDDRKSLRSSKSAHSCHSFGRLGHLAGLPRQNTAPQTAHLHQLNYSGTARRTVSCAQPPKLLSPANSLEEVQAVDEASALRTANQRHPLQSDGSESQSSQPNVTGHPRAETVQAHVPPNAPTKSSAKTVSIDSAPPTIMDDAKKSSGNPSHNKMRANKKEQIVSRQAEISSTDHSDIC